MTTSCISSLYQAESPATKEIYHLAMLEYLTKMYGQDLNAILHEFLKPLKQLIKKRDKKGEIDDEMNKLSESLIRKALNTLLPRYLNSDFASRQGNTADPNIRVLHKFFSWYSSYTKSTEYMQEKDLSALNRMQYKDFFLKHFQYVTYQSSKETFYRDLFIANVLLFIGLKLYNYSREDDFLSPPCKFVY